MIGTHRRRIGIGLMVKAQPARAKAEPPAKDLPRATPRRRNLAPIEIRVMAAATEAKPESSARKLIDRGLIVLFAGALTFATAVWTGYSQHQASQCEIARDVLMDDQLNPAVSEQHRREIVADAEREFKDCLND